MNVLFVDDQISVLDGIEAGVHFDTLGIENVYYATSAKRAMEIIGNNPVDVVVSDVEMPGEDGLWLVRNIREQYPEMPRRACGWAALTTLCSRRLRRRSNVSCAAHSSIFMNATSATSCMRWDAGCRPARWSCWTEWLWVCFR